MLSFKDFLLYRTCSINFRSANVQTLLERLLCRGFGSGCSSLSILHQHGWENPKLTSHGTPAPPAFDITSSMHPREDTSFFPLCLPSSSAHNFLCGKMEAQIVLEPCNGSLRYAEFRRFGADWAKDKGWAALTAEESDTIFQRHREIDPGSSNSKTR
jgi:hypothetical protein